MNVAVIFAGGVGTRMKNSDIPKQFIEILGKPIIIHTLEVFENCDEVGAIVIACVEGWIEFLNDLVEKYNISKVKSIVPGGETGQLSIYNGVKKAYELFPKDSVVLIHDGVRPFINCDLIKQNIYSVKATGSSISCVFGTETFLLVDGEDVKDIPERSRSMIAKAPQGFILKDIYDVHNQALEDGIKNSIDTCTLMNMYKKDLSIVMTDHKNIKITTDEDLIIGQRIMEEEINKNDS